MRAFVRRLRDLHRLNPTGDLATANCPRWAGDATGADRQSSPVMRSGAGGVADGLGDVADHLAHKRFVIAFGHDAHQRLCA